MGLVGTVKRFDAIVMLDAAGLVVAGSSGGDGGRLDGLLGERLDVFYPSEEVARGEPARHLAEAAVVGHVEHEGWRVRGDGSPFWADVVLTAVSDAAGRVRGYGMVMHDATDRRAAQRAVRASEEHLDLLRASSRDYAVLMLDLDGRVVSWSAGAQRVKGYRAEEIIGRSFATFYPPEEVLLGEPERHLAEAAAAGHVEHEGWRVRGDGSLFWANVVITAVLDDDGQLCGYGKVTYDANRSRDDTDPSLRGRADDVRLWVASVRDYAMLMLDPAGRVIGWNSGAERIKGYRAEEILGRSFAVFYPPEELERGEPTRHLAEASAAGHVEYEGWRLRQDGTRFWADVVITAVFDDTGAVRGYGKVTRDATARREAQLALRESEEHFLLLVAGVHDHAILMLDTDGCVVSWNVGAERIQGHPAEQIVGRSHAVFYPPEEVVAGVPARHLAEAATSGRVQHEGWRVRRDGSRFWADIVITAVFGEGGELRGYGAVVRDSSERRSAEQALRDSQELFGLLVASVRDHAILMLDPSGHVATWNPGAEHVHGYAADDIIGRPFDTFYAYESIARGEPARHLAEASARGQVEYEGWRVRSDGSQFWADVVLTACLDDQGVLRGYGEVTRDASDRRRLQAALVHQTLHDPLTGLGNRTLLLERLDHARTRLSRRRGVLTLLFLDLDRFKLVNDTMGHDVGDELLVQAADLLRAAVRPEDTVVRFGGDELVVLCEDVGDRSDVESLARRVTAALNVPVTLRDREVYLSASIGVVSDDGRRTARDFLRDADAAMYRAKEQGGGRYAVLDGTGAAVGDRLQVATELHRALERAELRAWYQPMSDLHSGEVLASEALVRWDHPTRGLLAPAAFLDVAEDVGTIVEFDAWMLGTACADTVRHGRRLGRPVGVWVNLSGRSLADASLPGSVDVALTRSGLDPGLLTLEITEGALMRDAAATVRTLASLHELGVRLAIDDFGTGYSSLAYLQRFPVDALKVDRSFVAGLDLAASDESTAIVRAVVSLAQALELRTVAEGVETEGQLAAVTALGCDMGQGFLLGRPAPSGLGG